MESLQKARKYFIAGLVVLIEVAILLFFLSLIWKFFSLLGMKLIENIIRIETPFFSSTFSFLIMMAITFLLGVFISSGVGKKLILLEEKLLAKIPFIGGAIFTFKIITDKDSPVLVENFRAGTFQVSHITRSWFDAQGEEMAVVYLPKTPLITDGNTGIFSKKEIERLDITGQEAMEFNATAGSNSPLRVLNEISRARDELIFRRRERKKVVVIENFLRGKEEEMHNSATARVQ